MRPAACGPMALLCLLAACANGQVIESPEDLRSSADAFWHQDDIPPKTGCRHDPECDDGNVCTQDSCHYDGTCIHIAQPALPCDDSNACTIGDLCSEAGECGGGELKNCNDLDDCTDDACDPSNGCTHQPTEDGRECDDGELCTSLDQCLGGLCIGTSPLCDDGNGCTADSCNPSSGECTHIDQTNVPCDDSNACTNGDICEAGACVPGTPAKCDDDNPCTADDCLQIGADQGGGCIHTPEVGKDCNDGNPCSIADSCTDSGICLGKGGSCDDGDPCTTDLCSPIDGCYHEAENGGSCDDGNPCTGVGTCSGGLCASGPAINCDDDVDCTADSCDVSGQCIHSPDDTLCDDDLFCNGTEWCDDDFGCLGDGPPDEDDGIACTIDSCLEEADILQHLPQHYLCQDDNPCTVDSCNPVVGCENVDKVCDDGNPCTSDSCDGATGECLFAPLGECCMVNSDCVSDDPCLGGLCDVEMHSCAFHPLLCDDHDPCTADGCAGGCKHDPIDGCDNECENDVDCFFAAANPDLCTMPSCNIENGVGSCSYPTRSCVDNHPCTDDLCDPALGCQYPSLPWCQQPCQDDLDCVSADACDAVACIDGTCANEPGLCDDGLACTGGECHPVTGECKLFECPACICPTCDTDDQCDDGNLCTSDICLLPPGDLPGQCRHVPLICNDGNPCTTDLCLPQSGCQFYKDPACTGCHDALDCIDDTLCTADSCVAGICEHKWSCQ